MHRRTGGLYDIARALSPEMGAHRTAQIVAAHAVEAFSAAGAWVERCVPSDRSGAGLEVDDPAGRWVEVLAATGEGTPPVGLRVMDPGSLTATAARTGEPEAVAFPEGLGVAMRAHLGPPAPGATPPGGRETSGMVVPLMVDDRAGGALVMRRRPGDTPFTGDDLARARPLGDVTAGVLGRMSLIEALRESEGRLRQVAEHLHEFIWLSDREFTTHYYVNAAYERIWGRSRASLYADARSLLDGVHPDDRQRVRDALLGMHTGAYDIEYRVVQPGGEVRWVWSRGIPVRREDGTIYRIAGITEDITERRRAAMERERLLAREREARATAEQRRLELEQVTESRTRLLRGFTHDVKNPLGAADGFLALLLEGVHGEVSAAQRASLERARRSIRSALDLVNQSLDIARAEAGELSLVRREVDLRALLLELCEDFTAGARARGLALAAELPAQLPAIVSDRARVVQVLANLVSNAVKYTPPGGRIVLRARVQARRGSAGVGHGGATGATGATGARGAAGGDPGWVAIEVSDTGKGIPPEQQGMLFREFTRFDPTAAQGAGIGLAISQRLAEALGGVIAVESQVGAGSTFTLWLPVAGGGVSPRQLVPGDAGAVAAVRPQPRPPR